MMLRRRTTILLIIATGIGLAHGECPNACSGRGSCGSFDMCTCDRNWQGSDCSLRTCPFGLAHVDTPKGDLDGSISVGDHNDILITGSTVYPYGTTEGYPHMVDSAGIVQTETAHDYMECSNKGLCDHKTGMCECLPGYDGAACQRASCPSKAESPNRAKSSGSMSNLAGGGNFNGRSAFSGRAQAAIQVDQCSGHGTCHTISELAFLDNENIYELWDKDTSMGCKCDSGYGGPNCSERQCKYGIDPLYTDDTTARVTHTTVRIESSASNTLSGSYALIFYDIHGEDYRTEPLVVSPTGVLNAVQHCTSVVAALTSLPNGVVPSVECSQSAINVDFGVEYTLIFKGNPGKLKELEIDEYLDGARSTILTSSGSYSADVYTKVLGEQVDYFPTKCNSITVKILADSNDGTNAWNADVRPGSLGYISGSSGDLTAAEAKLLKACLSDSDYDPENNIDVANWDKGFVVEAETGPTTYNMIGAFPHAIKVVAVETSNPYDQFTYGEYYLVWYDSTASSGKEFRVANLNSNDNTLAEATTSYIFTTTGTVQQLGYGNEADQEIADNSASGASSNRITGYWDRYKNKVYTNYDASCENNPSAGARNHKCVEKGDKLFIVDGCWGAGDLGAATSNPFFGGPNVYDCADSTAVNYNTGNIYTVTKVYTALLGSNSATSPSDTIDISVDPTLKRSVDTNIIEVDVNIGWRGLKGDPESSNTGIVGARDVTWSDNTGIVTLFHFTPPTAMNKKYDYVSQCSNRGLCDATSGLCQCFKGYTGDDCSIQNALAM